MTPQGVLAIVPLYHPASNGLPILESLLSQRDVQVDMLFVDNSPAEAAPQNRNALEAELARRGWERKGRTWNEGVDPGRRWDMVERPDNPGPGSAFAFGASQADGKRHSHVWFLDQDMRPQEDCLKILVDAVRDLKRPAAGTPARRNPSTGFDYREFVYRGGRARPVSRRTVSGPVEVDLTVYSGFLLDIRLAKEPWIPTEYFIDWDDLVMCLRLRRAGHPILFVPEALALHESGTLRRMMLGRGPPIGIWSTFRYYYIARNRIHFFHEVRKSHRASFARVVFGTLLHFLLFILWSRDRINKTRNLWRGFSDGLRGIDGKRPDRALGSPPG